jgi:phosphocarrier protein
VIEREVTVVNSLGMHARPAAQIVRLAATFAATLELECDGQRVNGKSIMGVMMLAAEQGAVVIVRAEGVDAEAAADAIAVLIGSGFGEA